MYKILVILSVDVTNYLRDNNSSVYEIKYINNYIKLMYSYS